MSTTTWNRGVSGARIALEAAREAFRQHTEDCPRWGYDGEDECNGCDQHGEPCRECVATKLAVRAARERLQRSTRAAGAAATPAPAAGSDSETAADPRA